MYRLQRAEKVRLRFIDDSLTFRELPRLQVHSYNLSDHHASAHYLNNSIEIETKTTDRSNAGAMRFVASAFK